MYILNAAGEEVASKSLSWNDASKQISENDSWELTKGTYYIIFKKDGWTAKEEGVYECKTGFAASGESFDEAQGGSNNTMQQASAIEFDKNYAGHIAINDEKDFYAINVPSARTLCINVKSPMDKLSFYVFDSTGKQICEKSFWKSDSLNEIVESINDIQVGAGTYYIAFSKNFWNKRGNYSFSVSSYYNVSGISLNATKKTLTKGKQVTLVASISPENATNKGVTWSSDNTRVAKVTNGKVTAVAPGVAVITATASDDTDFKATCTIIVKPKKVTCKKVKFYKGIISGNGFKVTFSKQNNVSYQIAYSKNKKFKKGVKYYTTSSSPACVTGLKKGKYYVKVRAYVTSNSSKAYGNWSKVKTVKVKK